MHEEEIIRDPGMILYTPAFADSLELALEPIRSALSGKGFDIEITKMDQTGLILTVVPELGTVVPEPGTLMLLISGGLGLLLVWRRRA